MFNKMVKVFKEKLDNGNGGYEWNCDAEVFTTQCTKWL